MAERLNQQTPMSAEEVLKTEIILNQALIDILIAKQIISEEELVNCIRKIKYEQEKMIADSRKIICVKRKI